MVAHQLKLWLDFNMLDVHCHFDLAPNPHSYILNNELKKIVTIGMTNLPSHFVKGVDHVTDYKFIRLALGLHPLLANEHESEYELFNESLDRTSYVGEVGLDFSKEGVYSRKIQIESFKYILNCIQAKSANKIINLHSRQAEKETLDLLVKHNVKNAIFHWYSGPKELLYKIIDNNYYLSVNSAMLRSAKGVDILKNIPSESLLTETDYPFIDNSSIGDVYDFFSRIWKIPAEDIEERVMRNFNKLIKLLS